MWPEETGAKPPHLRQEVELGGLQDSSPMPCQADLTRPCCCASSAGAGTREGQGDEAARCNPLQRRERQDLETTASMGQQAQLRGLEQLRLCRLVLQQDQLLLRLGDRHEAEGYQGAVWGLGIGQMRGCLEPRRRRDGPLLPRDCQGV